MIKLVTSSRCKKAAEALFNSGSVKMQKGDREYIITWEPGVRAMCYDRVPGSDEELLNLAWKRVTICNAKTGAAIDSTLTWVNGCIPIHQPGKQPISLPFYEFTCKDDDSVLFSF